MSVKAMLSGHPEKADSLLQQWQTTFADRVYFAIKRTQRANEDRFIEQAIIACQMPLMCLSLPIMTCVFNRR